MDRNEFGWETLLDTSVPKGCGLKAALFTTYDRPDECFLVEHLLPLLLNLTPELGEGAERHRFLLELDRRLKQLHDKLIVVSSMLRQEPGEDNERESGAYGWIWRSIRHHSVGKFGQAVQHAKLWILHWAGEDDNGDGIEYVEIVVSSANLTRAAFKGQLQAAWRVRLKLCSPRKNKGLDEWGVLPDFLRELGKSAGTDNKDIEQFVDLLARAECPKDVKFVASVPGTHSPETLRRTPWGAAGLRRIRPAGGGTVRASILSPFIGSWDAKSIADWCARFEGSIDRLELVWIDKQHPWCERWILPEATLLSLTESKPKATLLQLRREREDPDESDRLHEEHRPEDSRWCHAKVYSFQRGRSRQLLVTSANFSPAAWGTKNSDNSLTITNFEFGVSIQQAKWPFDKDDFELERLKTSEAWTTPVEMSPQSVTILWAQATWDGKQVRVECRCQGTGELEAKLHHGDESTPITSWTRRAEDAVQSASILWSDSKQPPSSVQLNCDEDELRVPVFDGRSVSEIASTLPPEIDEETAQRVRDELLFEQYGGLVAEDDDVAPSEVVGVEQVIGDTPPEISAEEDTQEGEVRRSDSYSVPVFDLARLYFKIVDCWSKTITCATTEFDPMVLEHDGRLLVEAFQRQAKRDAANGSANAIPAKLAEEELNIRLKLQKRKHDDISSISRTNGPELEFPSER